MLQTSLCPLSPTTTTAACFVLTLYRPPRHTATTKSEFHTPASFSHRSSSPLEARSDEQATPAMQTSALSSVYLIVASLPLKRRPRHTQWIFLNGILSYRKQLAHDAAQSLAAGATNPCHLCRCCGGAPPPLQQPPPTHRCCRGGARPDVAAQNIAQCLAHAAEAAPGGPCLADSRPEPASRLLCPHPPGGSFPAVIYLSALLTQGMPPSLMQLYNEVSDPKFFVVVSRGNGATIQTHGLICVAIGDFINVDLTGFHLGTPPPRKTAVLDQPALSSCPIMLFTIPFHMPVIGFVGTFGGFTLPTPRAERTQHVTFFNGHSSEQRHQ
ncbi:hypothetical protein B0H14DRAFT_3462527 [Mycena olivaceomarginata]|nr:hypothetical protein B0H14DRAFT_3462527 [Mycena olivaceomarginata]